MTQRDWQETEGGLAVSDGFGGLGGGEGRGSALEGVKREARGRGGDPVVGLLGRVAVALATTYLSGKGHKGIGSARNSLRLRAISGKAKKLINRSHVIERGNCSKIRNKICVL